jgi:hypothetical protein
VSTAIVTVKEVSPIEPQLTVYEKEFERRSRDRRLSPRVTLDKPLPCFIAGLGPASIRTLSLKGATIVSGVRPRVDMTHRMRLVYTNACVDVDAFIYRTVVDELFYSAEGSRLRFLSSARFDDPSVATLNLVYRILGDHWVDAGDDDTTPLE